jgi:hypothetical protein
MSAADAQSCDQGKGILGKLGMVDLSGGIIRPAVTAHIGNYQVVTFAKLWDESLEGLYPRPAEAVQQDQWFTVRIPMSFVVHLEIADLDLWHGKPP